MQQYSPFDKPINDLKPADLAILRSVSEGWYVDYKSALIDAGASAKAVSAFANTYGGWLFIGVKERSKDDPVADEFPGLSDRDVDVAIMNEFYEHGLPMIMSIATAFGIPAVEGTNKSQEMGTRYSEFWATGARAMRVQQNRNERRSEW